MTRTFSRLVRRPGLLLAVAAAPLLAAACSTTLVLDDARLEQVIATQFQQQTGVGLTGVSCPDDTPLAQGNTIQCTATAADGQTLTIQVTQTDNAGNVNWEVL
ncbi:MAG TPA: DUF4333 domain-containing protein [Candidatus Limnocylindrales bacterium]|jgi:hypothetical protein|nr:DUF4333 domain-containing protein [Candidatus Limnocylindrales bacterium]